MEAIEKTMEFIRFFDWEPKLPITKEPLDSKAAVFVYSKEGYYKINTAFYQNFNFPGIAQILELSARVVRIRAQGQNPELELFPCVDVKKVGFLRFYLEKINPEEGTLEAIDTEMIALIVGNLWIKNPKFLPLIKSLLPLDASEIIRRTTDFFPDGL